MKKTKKVKYNCSYCGGFELERTRQKIIADGMIYTDVENYTALHIKLIDEKTKKETNVEVCPICLIEVIGVNLPAGFFTQKTIKTSIKLLDSAIGTRKK